MVYQVYILPAELQVERLSVPDTDEDGSADETHEDEPAGEPRAC